MPFDILFTEEVLMINTDKRGKAIPVTGRGGP
jgi:hypothetical protein